MNKSLKDRDLKSIKIGVIGLGLIGGSLALKLSEGGFNVLGFARKKIVTSKFTVHYSFDELVVCDVVFICVSLREINNILEKIQPYLKLEAVVTDVGSVKKPICDFAEKVMRDDCVFIGGHPMAGTEKSGFENAFPELFKNRSWILSPPTLLEKGAESASFPCQGEMSEGQRGFFLLKKIIESTQAKILEVAPDKHDEAVAMISHLPLLLSIGLQKTVESIEDPSQKELATQLASTGFEGMVRLAKGNQVLNEDLLTLNKEELKKAYKKFLSESESALGT